MFLRRTPPPLLPVLMYHDLLGPSVAVPGSHRPYTLTTAAFRAQLVTLLDLRMAVTRLDSHLASSAGTGAVPRACVMTFDDGHESNLMAIVEGQDRKSTRLNSSHGSISYAVFCLKKKRQTETNKKQTYK